MQSVSNPQLAVRQSGKIETAVMQKPAIQKLEGKNLRSSPARKCSVGEVDY